MKVINVTSAPFDKNLPIRSDTYLAKDLTLEDVLENIPKSISRSSSLLKFINKAIEFSETMPIGNFVVLNFRSKHKIIITATRFEGD